MSLFMYLRNALAHISVAYLLRMGWYLLRWSMRPKKRMLIPR